MVPGFLERLVGSTSPPGGNQVDGLPPASNTKTVAKRARRGRLTVLLTLKNQFSEMFASMQVLGNPKIVVEDILKFIEMVLKCKNDFEISEFYRSQIFQKVGK